MLKNIVILKILANVLTSIWMPGALLISKGVKKGYYIFAAYCASLVIFTIPKMFFHFYSLTIFSAILVLLIILTNMYYLKYLSKRNNRPILVSLVFFMFLFHVAIGISVNSSIRNRLEPKDYSKSYYCKIDLIEKYILPKNIRLEPPNDVSKYFSEYMPTDSNLKEIKNWEPGIFFIATGQKAKCIKTDLNGNPYDIIIENKSDSQLDSLLNMSNNKLYFAFSSLLDSATFVKHLESIRRFHANTISVIYVKDTLLVEKHAYNPRLVCKVKNKFYDLESTNKKPSEAAALSVKSFVYTCPTFMLDFPKVGQANRADRPRILIDLLRKNVAVPGCYIEDAIDFCMIIALPWNTYSIKEESLDDLYNYAKSITGPSRGPFY